MQSYPRVKYNLNGCTHAPVVMVTVVDQEKLKLGDQNKPLASHKVCRRCEEDLRLWFKVPHISEIPIPHPPSSLDNIRSDSKVGNTLYHQDETSSDFSFDEGPQPFSQSQPTDLVRDLGLSKDLAELNQEK
ncbi:hypothetical protein AVEN_70608-1 [Araneus ventricosus]|uniref:Uncharacterized protein n=1 Tax=Araneus ventricosus TaxID=182803 RepID=A0A4Y2CFK9_ARAVE|nr:hypothetical protein AVEN_70608-1 [Araneus ventricosus]